MATAAFLKRWRSGAGKLHILASIALPRIDGTQTDTLYVGTSDCATPANSGDGSPRRFWLGAIESVGSVSLPGGFGTNDLPLCTGALALNADVAIKFPAGVGGAISTTIRKSLTTHVWINATVTMWRHFDEFADFVDAQSFVGFAVIDWTLDDALMIHLRQSTAWNKPLTPRTISRNEFPRALQSAVGAGLPILYGDMSIRKMRRPFPSVPIDASIVKLFNVMDANTNASGRHSRGMLVDIGRGGAASINQNAKVLVAGHALKSVYDDQAATAVWLQTDGGKMMLLDSPSTIINSATGAGIGLPDDFAGGIIARLPSDVTIQANMAKDPRNILDPSDTSYAYFNPALSYTDLLAVMEPYPAEAVTFEQAYVIGYVSTPNLAAFRFWIVYGDPAVYVYVTTLGPSQSATDPTIYSTGFYAQGVDAYHSMAARFYAPNPGGGSTTPAGEARVFFMGSILRMAPKKTYIQSERIIEHKFASVPPRTGPLGGKYHGPLTQFTQREVIPPVAALVGDFYANVMGVVDDGTGLYTGTAAALIERAPDIMVHMLETYGGVPLAKIERGVSSFGSFVLARSFLTLPSGWTKHAVGVAEDTDLLPVLQWLANESMSMLLVTPYDGLFRLVVWRTDPAVDYPWTFGRSHIRDPRGPTISTTPLPDVVTGVRVIYGYDARRGTQRAESALTFDRSVSGEEYRGLRDQYMTVVTTKNDRLDFQANTVAGGAWITRVATLAAGSYVPQSTLAPGAGDVANGLAQQTKFRMAAAEGLATSRYQVTWGTQVTASYNDLLAFGKTTLGTLTTATIPASKYATCDLLAAACQTAANTALAADVFRCSYDRTKNKYGIWANLSTPVIKIKAGFDYTDSIMQRSTWASLGFYNAGSDFVIPFGSGNRIFGDVRVEEHYAITNLGHTGAAPAPTFEFELLWQSGASGSDSAVSVRHCADLLGFGSADDRTIGFSGNNGHSYCGDGPKGNREIDMLKSATLYGPRREVVVQSRTIYHTDTARSLRDRMADLFRAPRTIIRFTTGAAPDIERGQVIAFDSTMDSANVKNQSRIVYPSGDGLWVGKKFVVVEVSHNMGPASLDTEIVAVDASSFV